MHCQKSKAVGLLSAGIAISLFRYPNMDWTNVSIDWLFMDMEVLYDVITLLWPSAIRLFVISMLFLQFAAKS